MGIPRRKRSSLAAQRSDRLVFCLSAAVAFHLGMLTALGGVWRPLEPTDLATEPLPESAEPIDFVYLEPPEQPVETETGQQSTVDSVAAGDRQPERPTNPGKPEIGDAIAVKPSEPPGKTIPQPSPSTSGSIIPISSIPNVQEQGQAKGLAPASDIKAAAVPPISAPTVIPAVEQPLPPALRPPTSPEISPVQLPLLEINEANEADETNEADKINQTDGIDTAAVSEQPSLQPSLPALSPADPLLPAQTIPETSPEPLGGQGLEGSPNPSLSAPDDTTAIATNRDEMWGDYIAVLNQEINQQWQRIELDTTREAKVRFSIDSGGGLVNLELSLSSGSDRADQAAIDAVIASAPFEPFPEQVTEDLLTVNFTFTYHILDPARSF